MSNAAQLLLDTAVRGELHHAVILHGASPSLLREAALQTAKALNCINGTAGDGCTTCQRIERRLHPDVHHLEVSGERKMISVEQIRELVAEAALRPYEGRNKVFIVDPADALSPGGSNSLLKTLEEPARDTHFILLTRSPDLLLPTIRSRSQAIYLGGEETEDADLRREIVALLQRFTSRRETAALLGIATLVAAQENEKEAMALLGRVLRDAAAGRDIAGNVAPGRWLAAGDGILAAIRGLTVNADPRLVVEQALAELVK